MPRPSRVLRLLITGVSVLLCETSQARPFRIEVVDEATGRGVPLVELRTVNQIRLVTDSNGIVAFEEPGLMGRKVFFHVKSHGYEFPRDGFGNRGIALDVTDGGTARVSFKRLNIASRLYRVTGAGIYRDSLLVGAKVPVREPVLNGQVLGQDSVLSAVFRGRIYWFWGDTNRPDYPLGNFHTPGATSELPGQGGLDPEVGVNLTYFAGETGFARPTCQMPGPGPTWLTGLVVLRDDMGRERMFANYAKIKPPMEVYERGVVEFDADKGTFLKRAQLPSGLKAYPGEHPGGHTIVYRESGQGEGFVYYCNPYPLVRMPADPDRLVDTSECEAFTCLAPGTRFEDRRLDRSPDGVLRYGWKKHTATVSQAQQATLVREGKIKAEEGLLQLRDVIGGKTVLAHGGSVAWNAFRRRWTMVAVEVFGKSFLGEVWYAEADTPRGPWVYARKVVTHEDYSFYNPRHHPMFDKAGGKILFFEGTYTSSFSGNKDPTPRYDYNQVMYRLDLEDPRLALPVPIYQVVEDASGRCERLATRDEISARMRIGGIAFFAPDRPGIATIPVRWRGGARADDRRRNSGTPGDHGQDRVLCYAIPADSKEPPPGTVALHSYRQQGGDALYLGLGDSPPRSGFSRDPTPLGLVWKNPGSQVFW